MVVWNVFARTSSMRVGCSSKDRAFTLDHASRRWRSASAPTRRFLRSSTRCVLRPLPVPEADRLVLFYNSYPKAGVGRSSTGVPDYYDRLRETDVFEELALYNQRGVTVGTDDGAQRLQGMIGRPSLYRLLRAKPLRGRIFTENEGEAGQDRKVILSYGLWQRMFAGSDAAVGQRRASRRRPVRDRRRHAARFSFRVPRGRALATALVHGGGEIASRHSNNWTMIGRLNPARAFSRRSSRWTRSTHETSSASPT